MKFLKVGCGVVLVAATYGFFQAPGTTPAQPFPSHEMPPNGWYCSPTDTHERTMTDAHACECLGMIKDPVCKRDEQDTDDDGMPVGPPHEVPNTNDNAKCKVFCHKDHCTCAIQCQDSN